MAGNAVPTPGNGSRAVKLGAKSAAAQAEPKPSLGESKDFIHHGSRSIQAGQENPDLQGLTGNLGAYSPTTRANAARL